MPRKLRPLTPGQRMQAEPRADDPQEYDRLIATLTVNVIIDSADRRGTCYC